MNVDGAELRGLGLGAAASVLAFAVARGLEGAAALEMLMAEVHKGWRDPEMVRAFREVVGGLRVDPPGGTQTAWCAT